MKDKFLEIFAVVFNLLFTLLYLNGNEWCYLFGVLGPLLFIFLCIRKKLYAEPLLQLFYIAFAMYGVFNVGTQWTIVHWPWQTHLYYITAGAVLALLGGWILKSKTSAKFPFLDSAATVYGIVGTWLMVNYVHENWLYFIVVNTLCIYIYFCRRMYVGTIMFCLYLLMSMDGYFEFKIFY